jgi:phage baseplate assembly protein W
MPDPARFGTDLRLLGNLEQQEDRRRGEDLKTATRRQTGRVDLEPLSGVENLQQALLLRFLTHRGELAPLGHRTYGSRLHELIGEPNTETTRNRAKLFALEALREEPRVAEVLDLRVTSRRQNPTRIDIAAELRAVDGDTPVNLVFPFFLDGGAGP